MGQNAPPESGNPKSGRARADFCWGGIRAGQQKCRAEEIQGVQMLSAEIYLSNCKRKPINFQKH